MRDKDNEDEIRNAIQSVCRILPSSVDDQCELLVGKRNSISWDDCKYEMLDYFQILLKHESSKGAQ